MNNKITLLSLFLFATFVGMITPTISAQLSVPHVQTFDDNKADKFLWEKGTSPNGRTEYIFPKSELFNVGIGTKTPDAKLHVIAESKKRTDAAMRVYLTNASGGARALDVYIEGEPGSSGAFGRGVNVEAGGFLKGGNLIAAIADSGFDGNLLKLQAGSSTGKAIHITGGEGLDSSVRIEAGRRAGSLQVFGGYQFPVNKFNIKNIYTTWMVPGTVDISSGLFVQDAATLLIDGQPKNVGRGDLRNSWGLFVNQADTNLDGKLKVTGETQIKSLRGTYTGGAATVCVRNDGTLFASDDKAC